MEKLIITGETLKKWGMEEGPAIGIAIGLLNAMVERLDPRVIKLTIKTLVEQPAQYAEDADYGIIARTLIEQRSKTDYIEIAEAPKDYKVYGADYIEAGAKDQMDMAMRLPIVHSGALMPDAHHGYGLPIGGVLATNNAIIPYGVGVDIGCRMCMSIFPDPIEGLSTHNESFQKILRNNTQFGRAEFKRPRGHEVLESSLFSEIPIVKHNHARARRQIGSSGGGNHFVEFGITEIVDANNEFGLAPGKYLALLSHSGSRGMGAAIANHYTKLAMQECKLPREAKHLAWFDLDSELGQEYWLAMNLAGDYASACHHQIHERVAIGLRSNPLAMIENHHNFAWKEKDALGNEIIVHRKGATPAGAGVLGIIPGSMTAPGYIVRGKGEANSINSAAHGAGRQMSRTKAKAALTDAMVREHLEDHQVTLMGAGLDEAPMAYKDIRKVMAAQADLVDIVGEFLPKIVRMCGDKRFRAVD